MAKKNDLPQPYGSRVLIRIDKAEKASKGGIILPDSSREEDRRGTVVAAGKPERDTNGIMRHEPIEPGARIIFEGGYGASRFELDGQKYVFISYDGIVAVLQ